VLDCRIAELQKHRSAGFQKRRNAALQKCRNSELQKRMVAEAPKPIIFEGCCVGAFVSLLEEKSSIVRQRMLRIWVEGRLLSPGVQMRCCRSRRRVDAHLLIGDAAAAMMLCTDQRVAELSIHAVIYRLQRVLA